MALFLFLLANAALTSLQLLTNFVTLRSLFPFQQAQYVLVFPLKPAPFCELSAGLGSANKSAIAFFLLYDFRSALSSISIFTSNSLVWQELSYLCSCTIRLKWATGHSSLQGNDAPDGLDRREAPLALSGIPCSLPPLTSCIHSCLFSDWTRIVSSRFFDTQVPSVSIEELVLPRHTRCALSSSLQRT